MHLLSTTIPVTEELTLKMSRLEMDCCSQNGCSLGEYADELHKLCLVGVRILPHCAAISLPTSKKTHLPDPECPDITKRSPTMNPETTPMPAMDTAPTLDHKLESPPFSETEPATVSRARAGCCIHSKTGADCQVHQGVSACGTVQHRGTRGALAHQFHRRTIFHPFPHS